MTDLPAIIARLEAATEQDCVLWPLALDRGGRGRIWHGGKLMLAHRWVWERIKGVIPAGKLLCHTCDNPTCVNPRHLYVGTHADNMRDMKVRRRYFAARNPERAVESGRRLGLSNTWARGSKNPKAKLSDDDARSIRASSLPTKKLAATFGVHRTIIQRIRRGTLWAA